jgi:hypothetical protein
MNWLKWAPGRQGGDYQKKLIIAMRLPWLFGFDMYVLKFAPNFNLPEHIDKVDKGIHLRMNIIIKGSGEFKCEKSIIRTRRLILFRPDKYLHSMKNGDSERKVISIGLNF